MHTQCPHCETVFAISAAQLEAAAGTVRCGECGHTFDAKCTLREQVPGAGHESAIEPPALEPAAHAAAEPLELPPEPLAAAGLGDGEGLALAEDGGSAQALHPAVPDEFIPEPEAATVLGEEAIIPEKPKASDTTRPRLTPDAAAILGLEDLAPHQGRTHGWFATTLWTLGILVLAAALVVQSAYFFRDELARYGSVRPWLVKLCALAECEVPLRKDLSWLEFASRDVRTHPDVPHALLVNVVFVNTASFPQPYPLLQFRLTNLNGATMASRSFQPAEYLDKGTNINKGVMPNTPVHAKLEIKDPGEQAVSYEFDFH